MGRIYVGDEGDLYSNAKFYYGKLSIMTSPVCVGDPGYEEFFVMYCDHCGSLDVSSLKRKRTNVSQWEKETHLTPLIKRLLGKATHSRWEYFQLYFSCNTCGAVSYTHLDVYKRQSLVVQHKLVRSEYVLSELQSRYRLDSEADTELLRCLLYTSRCV